MELTAEAIKILLTLLPGFVTLQIAAWFSPRAKLSKEDWALQILTVSLLNYLLAGILYPVLGLLPLPIKQSWGLAPVVGSGVAEFQALGTVGYLNTLLIASLLLGVVVGGLGARDLPYAWLRKWKWSVWSSRNDVWQATLIEMSGKWATVHLSDDKKICGWVKWYSASASKAALFVKDAAWIDAQGNQIPAGEEGVLLVPASGIKLVEFHSS
jgi:hypothetical protein